MASGRSNAALNGQLETLCALGATGSLSDGQLLERFLAHENRGEAEAAFAALVDRHGPMVLGVCRQALPCSEDANDAFQATFLVLVQRARAIQGRGSVAGWLFGIARRVAARARVEAARRHRRVEALRQETPANAADSSPHPTAERDSNFGPLFEELAALPERFRAPIVLHYLEGLSTEATAVRLGCARGTVLSRLARARGKLRARLEQRGISLTGFLPVIAETHLPLLETGVPPALLQTTVRAGMCSALAGTVAETAVSSGVMDLSKHVARGLLLARVRAVAVLILFLSVGVAAGLATTARAIGKFAGQAPSGAEGTNPRAVNQLATPAKPAGQEPDPSVIIRGQVVTTDGQPIQDAQIFLSRPQLNNSEIRSSELVARSGSGGRFGAVVARARLEQLQQFAVGRADPTWGPILGAIAPGFAINWIKTDVESIERGRLTITLTADDIPIEAQIKDLEGRPIPRLTVRAIQVAAVEPGFLEKLRANKGRIDPTMFKLISGGIPLGDKGQILSVTTDSTGRFRLQGVGRDRIAVLFVDGDRIERSEAMVCTARDPAGLPAKGTTATPVFGPRFELAVAPGRAVEGVVRDAETRQPIAGATVLLYGSGLTAKTDDHGHFRLAGQPQSKLGVPNLVAAFVEGQPYVKVVASTPDPKGLESVRAEIALKRGAWVEGRVVDRTTGKPVQAMIEYTPFDGNPNRAAYAGASFLDRNIGDEAQFPTDADGRFRAVALPGGGVLGVRTFASNSYLSAPRLAPEYFIKVGLSPVFRTADVFQAMIPIEVNDRATLLVRDIKVGRARPLKLLICDNKGQPLSGATVVILERRPLDPEAVAGSEYTFMQPTPAKTETVVVVHAKAAIGGCADLTGKETSPIEVRLRPLGSARGRLVDEKGRPRPDVEIHAIYLRDQDRQRFVQQLDASATTDNTGRFQLTGLVPGLFYSFHVIKPRAPFGPVQSDGLLQEGRWTLKPEPQDWGDIQVAKRAP
jgi:RNA polymerase sigma factor (sigma-70 family)